jgi:hypothetical protein
MAATGMQRLAIATGHETPTGDLIPANRMVDWSRPGLTAVGGIPNRATIYKTISPSGGDDTPEKMRVGTTYGIC